MALLGMVESCSIISSFEGIFLCREEVCRRDITSIRKKDKERKEERKALLACCLIDGCGKITPALNLKEKKKNHNWGKNQQKKLRSELYFQRRKYNCCGKRHQHPADTCVAEVHEDGLLWLMEAAGPGATERRLLWSWWCSKKGSGSVPLALPRGHTVGKGGISEGWAPSCRL